MQTEASLIATRMTEFIANLFGERHIEHRDRETGEPLYHTVTTKAIIAAHHNLGLFNRPWPAKEAALGEVRAVQIELDRLLLIA